MKFARIALLLYRGLVNKLNQIRSALPLVTGVFCVCELQFLALSPRPFFFFMANDGGEKIATIGVKGGGGRGGQTEVQRDRGHCASSSRVGLLVSFLSFRRVLVLV